MNAEDIFEHVTYRGECWEWSRGRTAYGYGRARVDGVSRNTHRVAYLQANGKIPAGMVVRHTCDNPPCINPEHLILGTQADNARDAVERGGIKTHEQASASRWPDDTVRQARAMHATTGMTYREVADALGVPFTTVREWLQGRVRNTRQEGRKPAGARR